MDTRYLKDRYVNPYTDFGFKKLFGTEINKDLLISFINSLLHGKEVVKDLTYLNTEHLGTGESDRKAVFDVYCENENGEKILVEMQRGVQEYFKDRSLYYATFPIREQGQKGEWNYQLKAVYVIGILNFKFDKVHDNYYHHEVQLLDVETKEVFGMFEKWLFVLRNLSRLMERPKALQERIFTRLFETAEIAKFTKVEYDAYEESLKVYRDWKNTIDTAELKGEKKGFKKGHKEGLEKGEKIGIEKGEKRKAIEMALEMKADNEPIAKIMKYTKLTEEEINQLCESGVKREL